MMRILYSKCRYRKHILQSDGTSVETTIRIFSIYKIFMFNNVSISFSCGNQLMYLFSILAIIFFLNDIIRWDIMTRILWPIQEAEFEIANPVPKKSGKMQKYS